MKKVSILFFSIVMCICIIPMAFASETKFVDVKPTAWYYDDVQFAVESGLVNGKTATTYAPNDNLTYAEAIKLAACMNQLYVDGSVTLRAGNPWYQSYVDYCEDNGIISQKYNYNANATRAGYMEIFANALPDEGLKAINNVPNDAIPDVPSSRSYAESVYKLYRAGILTGVDEEHNCDPYSNIKRSEVAAILTRMMNEDKRISFSMGTEPEFSSGDFLMYADDVFVITDRGIVIEGKVVSGSLKLGDKLQIVRSDGSIMKAIATKMTISRKDVDSIKQGDNVSILLNKEITKDMITRGDSIIRDKSDLIITNSLKGTLKLLPSNENGGRITPIKVNDETQFYYPSDITGKFIDLNGEAVSPGETRDDVYICFPKNMGVWYVGQEFVVRDKGRTLGTFTVTEIILGFD